VEKVEEEEEDDDDDERRRRRGAVVVLVERRQRRWSRSREDMLCLRCCWLRCQWGVGVMRRRRWL
jgi:hypothetical protein